jgi:hypothetical protein
MAGEAYPHRAGPGNWPRPEVCLVLPLRLPGRPGARLLRPAAPGDGDRRPAGLPVPLPVHRRPPADGEMLTLFYHLTFPGLGRVRRVGEAFGWEVEG